MTNEPQRTSAGRLTKKRDAELLFSGYKPVAFFQFSLLSSASLLTIHIVVVQKFCYHGNETSHLNELSNLL